MTEEERLEKLKGLLHRGNLSEHEFEAARLRLLTGQTSLKTQERSTNSFSFSNVFEALGSDVSNAIADPEVLNRKKMQQQRAQRPTSPSASSPATPAATNHTHVRTDVRMLWEGAQPHAHQHAQPHASSSLGDTHAHTHTHTLAHNHVRGAPTREGAMSTVLQSTALHTAMHTATHNATHTATRIATHTNPSNHNDTSAYQQQRAHMHAHAHSHTHAQGVSLGGASSATTLQHASPASATSPQHASRQEKRGGKVGMTRNEATVTYNGLHWSQILGSWAVAQLPIVPSPRTPPRGAPSPEHRDESVHSADGAVRRDRERERESEREREMVCV